MKLPKSNEISDKKISSLLAIGEMFPYFDLRSIRNQAALKGYDSIAVCRTVASAKKAFYYEVNLSGLILV